jgi:hypothetical protein
VFKVHPKARRKEEEEEEEEMENWGRRQVKPQ